MLSKLIEKLNQAEARFDHLQLAEALWLSQFAPRVEVLPEIISQPEAPTPDKQAQSDLPPQSQPKPKPQESKKLFAAKPQTASVATLPARAVRVPDVSALPDALAVGRALRPLRRRVASRRDWQLDEDATVEASAAASTRNLTVTVPVMRPAMERWFNVDFIVEQSLSMAVWRDVAREVHQLLEHTGAFGDVRRWTLFRSEGQARLRDAAGREHSPRQLRDSASRRLMIVFSDGSSRGWADGNAGGVYARTIADWAEHSTVVLLQPFGESLWARTLVGEATTEITSPEPGAPNAKLKTSLNWWTEPKGKQIALPIVSLNPEMIARWARLVALPGNTFRAAMLDVTQPKPEPTPKPTIIEARKRSSVWWQWRERLFSKSAATLPEPSAQPEPASKPSAAELVRAFQATASPEAFDLAVYLSLMPLTMEVMRVTQRAMFDAPQLEHLAEFLLGGLVVASPVEGDAGFEFRPGVRQELLPSTRRSEIEQLVRNAVSDMIGQRIGSVREFIALILDPKGKERLPVAADYAQFFAEITLPALRQMWPDFGADDATSEIQSETPPPSLRSDGTPSPVTMVSFDFKTVWLNKLGEVVNREPKSAWQYIEMLDSTPLEMVFVPGGKFLMGAPESEKESYGDERPQHEVSISPFYIGKFTVTQSQWRAVAAWKKIDIDLNPDPSRFKGDDLPVEQITWFEAKEFCARISDKTKGLYRLPTEAEWEYACRAGTTTPFAFGETITPEFVNYIGEYPYGKAKKGRYSQKTVTVGSLGAANDFGLFDMHGNVWEWCEDWHGDYLAAATTDPSGSSTGSSRVFRGGGWHHAAVYCRSAIRYSGTPGDRDGGLGFRLVRIGR